MHQAVTLSWQHNAFASGAPLLLLTRTISSAHCAHNSTLFLPHCLSSGAPRMYHSAVPMPATHPCLRWPLFFAFSTVNMPQPQVRPAPRRMYGDLAAGVLLQALAPTAIPKPSQVEALSAAPATALRACLRGDTTTNSLSTLLAHALHISTSMVASVNHNARHPHTPRCCRNTHLCWLTGTVGRCQGGLCAPSYSLSGAGSGLRPLRLRMSSMMVLACVPALIGSCSRQRHASRLGSCFRFHGRITQEEKPIICRTSGKANHPVGGSACPLGLRQGATPAQSLEGHDSRRRLPGA